MPAYILEVGTDMWRSDLECANNTELSPGSGFGGGRLEGHLSQQRGSSLSSIHTTIYMRYFRNLSKHHIESVRITRNTQIDLIYLKSLY